MCCFGCGVQGVGIGWGVDEPSGAFEVWLDRSRAKKHNKYASQVRSPDLILAFSGERHSSCSSFAALSGDGAAGCVKPCRARLDSAL